MDVRSRSLTADGSPERVVGDSGTLEIAAQPGAFPLVRIQGYVYSSAMVETERAMQRRIALGADRKHFTELSLEGIGDPHEVGFPEQAALRRNVRWCGGAGMPDQLPQDRLPRAPAPQVLDQIGPEFRQIQSFTAKLQIFEHRHE